MMDGEAKESDDRVIRSNLAGSVPPVTFASKVVHSGLVQIGKWSSIPASSTLIARAQSGEDPDQQLEQQLLRWDSPLRDIRNILGNETASYINFARFSTIRYLLIGIVSILPSMLVVLTSTNSNNHGRNRWLDNFFFIPGNMTNFVIFYTWLFCTVFALFGHLIFPFWFAYRVQRGQESGEDEFINEGRAGTNTRFDTDHRSRAQIRLTTVARQVPAPVVAPRRSVQDIRVDVNVATIRGGVAALAQYTNSTGSTIDRSIHVIAQRIRQFTWSYLWKGYMVGVILFVVLLGFNISVNLVAALFLNTNNQVGINALLSLILVLFNLVWQAVSIHTTFLESHSELGMRNSLFWKTFFFRMLTEQFLLWFPIWSPSYALSRSGSASSSLFGRDWIESGALQRDHPESAAKIGRFLSLQERCIILVGVEFVSGFLGGLFVPMAMRHLSTLAERWLPSLDGHSHHLLPTFVATQEYAKMLTRNMLVLQCVALCPGINLICFVFGIADMAVERVKIIYLQNPEQVVPFINTYTTELRIASLFIFLTTVFLPLTGSFWILSEYISAHAFIVDTAS